LFQAANAFHEEFIEIAADDCEVLDAFQQGSGVIRSHMQDPAIELQPGQFPVQVEFRGIQVDCRHRLFACHSCGFLRPPGPG